MESTEKKVKEEADVVEVKNGNENGIGGFFTTNNNNNNNDDKDRQQQFASPDPPSLLPPPQFIRSKFSTAGGSGPNAPPPAQLTIFYAGTVSVFDAVPAEKAQAIMAMAAAATAAKASVDNNTSIAKNGGGVPATPGSPVLTRSPSLQSTAAVEASPLSRLPSFANPSLCKLQAELPIARRHSLQRFLEKRRDRLVSKCPYAPATPTKTTETTEGGLSETANLLC